MAETDPPATYAGAGVDVEAGRRAVELIRRSVASTARPEVVGDLGGFGGIFALDPARWRRPLLVSSTDGVGTKLLVAQALGRHDTVGIDLVAMSVDDVVAQGAEPLFFLDYILIERLVPALVDEIVSGIAAGCREARCALIGGEMAEHPGHLAPGSYDLAGFCVGVVEHDRLVTGARITPGDLVIGLASSGLHSNGYSLARKVLLSGGDERLGSRPPGLGATLGEELLRPTAIYAPAVLALLAEVPVRGLAHVTGGGIPENLGRILPDGVRAEIDAGAWERPAIFDLIASEGPVEQAEMFRTFNMGIGMIAVVAPGDAARALAHLESTGHRAWEVGRIVGADGDRPPVVIR
ncbi:MAG TPA: phosphoribosylformylglycinamidine cyclo-ligase [Actinomycetota bacterium]|nr:phosphoribosylformylglycinamidine cyclo-ligase [Actinomycetota bacterium]